MAGEFSQLALRKRRIINWHGEVFVKISDSSDEFVRIGYTRDVKFLAEPITELDNFAREHEEGKKVTTTFTLNQTSREEIGAYLDFIAKPVDLEIRYTPKDAEKRSFERETVKLYNQRLSERLPWDVGKVRRIDFKLTEEMSPEEFGQVIAYGETFDISVSVIPLLYDDSPQTATITITRTSGSFPVSLSLLGVSPDIDFSLSETTTSSNTVTLTFFAKTSAAFETNDFILQAAAAGVGITTTPLIFNVADPAARFYHRMYAHRKGVAFLSDGRCFLSELQKAAYTVFSFTNSPIAPTRYANSFAGFGRLWDDFYRLGNGTHGPTRVAIMKSLVFNSSAVAAGEAAASEIVGTKETQFNAAWTATTNFLSLLEILQLPSLDIEATQLNMVAFYRGYSISAAPAAGEGTFTGSGFTPFRGWDGAGAGSMLYNFRPHLTSAQQIAKVLAANRFTNTGDAVEAIQLATDQTLDGNPVDTLFMGAIIRATYPANGNGLKLIHSVLPDGSGDNDEFFYQEGGGSALMLGLSHRSGNKYFLAGIGRRATFRDLPFGFANRNAFDPTLIGADGGSQEGAVRQLSVIDGAVINAIVGLGAQPDAVIQTRAELREYAFTANRRGVLGNGIDGFIEPRFIKQGTDDPFAGGDITKLANEPLRLGGATENAATYRGVIVGNAGGVTADGGVKAADLICFLLKAIGVPDINT